ncbi:ABC transporter ATP-binding protein [Undibacterium sp. Jales W-56]|uniref:ABC transporter ATP-binding protein n=1 Tax=Undibacterium sp. Jales W-56 TaxID=2897325 RepID=UPI0021D3107E|nr:ABC transporter ATP-binding protein [Undibacterium sp. Jales W-56]MCU6433020.1 ABC transporter ATP-binding protein [Undibacterium sp. Jales W-56]
MNTATQVLLTTSDLSLSAGKRVLLDALQWQVKSGECWCVIGRNGAGKSTLLRTLAGMRPVERGTVVIRNKKLQQWPLSALARERSFLPQGRVDAFGYRAIETVLSARHPYHDAHYWESPDDLELAHAALQELDVAEMAERDVRSLSGGERQRVAIAALLAQDAALMLLDEPANALDLAHQVSVMQLFSRLCREQNKAVVMVSHDLNLAHRIATHALLLMGDGRWQAGPVEQVMTADKLGLCLGHPLELIRHGEHTLFLPGH